MRRQLRERSLGSVLERRRGQYRGEGPFIRLCEQEDDEEKQAHCRAHERAVPENHAPPSD